MSPEAMQPTGEKKQTYGEYKEAQRKAREDAIKGVETYRQHKEGLRGVKEAQTLGNTGWTFRGSKLERLAAYSAKGVGIGMGIGIKQMVKLGLWPAKYGLSFDPTLKKALEDGWKKREWFDKSKRGKRD